MSVLKGEGKVPILFGMSSVPSGPHIHSAYLARPDLVGGWPTIVVVSPPWGVTSSVKDICRRLARHGFAVLAPELHPNGPLDRSIPLEDAITEFSALDEAAIRVILDGVVEFVVNSSGFWSSAERGYGILGLGIGGIQALSASAVNPCSAVALVSSPFGGTQKSEISSKPALLVLHGRDDAHSPLDDALAFRASVLLGEFVLYDGAGHGFFDDYSDDYSATLAVDVIGRLVSFFEKELPDQPAVS